MKAVCFTLSYLNPNDVDPMGHLRLIAPLERAGIEIILGYENGKSFPHRISEGDLVIIQRHFPVNFDDYEEIVKHARTENKPIVFELDDLLFLLPENHPDRLAHVYTPSLLPMFQALLEADLVTVPTYPLRNFLSHYNGNIEVLPNYFDDQLWNLREPLHNELSEDVIVIGFMGTKSHLPDIDFILPVLLEILHLFPSKVHLHFWGLEPPPILANFSNVGWTPWYSYCYKNFAEFFQTQKADIFIAPLVDNIFNRCKSPLKFYEYSALGSPGVYSNVDPYNKVIQHGVHGLLASSLDEWRIYLTMLIKDCELRKNIAENAQRKIIEELTLSQNAHIWKETYRKLIKEHRSRNNDQGFINLIDTINQQTSAYLSQQKQEIDRLGILISQQSNRIESLNSQVKEQEMEILNYVTSRSWRYTRPFRKLDKLWRGK